MKKRILSIALSICFVFTLFGCESKKGSDEFSAFLEDMPLAIMGDSSMDINFLFDKPEDFGIKVKQYELPYTSHKEYQEMLKESKEILKQLETYRYEDLNEDQKITYDVLQYTYQNIVDEGDDYYLATNYFDVNGGVQAQLSLNLWMYEFKNQVSLDSFIAILNDMPKTMKKYIDLEKTRQDKGFGMSQTYLDKVKEDVKKFNANSHEYIVEAAFERIDNADFVKDKQAYKDKVSAAYTDNFMPAYAILEQELNQLEVKTKDKDAALVDYKGGKDYYMSMIDRAVGIDDAKKYEEFLDDQEKKIMERLIAFMSDNPDYYEKMTNETLQNIKYTDLTTVDEVLQFQEQKVLNDKQFPKIEPLDYRMLVVPKAIQEIFQASAAYFISPYDAKESKETMVLNGEYSQSDYGTIAHEGFPGHMYQHNYFKSVKHDIVRDLLSNNGYSEGWAVYAEHQMDQYAQDKIGAEFASINQDLTYLYILKLDKMIHYDNITREEAYDYLSTNFGISEESDLREQYEQLLLNPAVFVQYYGAYYKFQDLKEEAKDAWEDDFTNLKFNEQVLQYGPLPLELLDQYMSEDFN